MLKHIVVVIIVILAAVFLFMLFSNPAHNSDLVPQGGKRIKNMLSFLMVKSGIKHLPEWQTVKNADNRLEIPEGVDKEQFNDSFVFQGSDNSGNVFLARIGFRGGGKEAEVWFWGVFDGKKYVNDTRLVKFNEPDLSGMSAGGLEFIKTGSNTWQIKYNGTLNGNPAEVKLNWTNKSAIYSSAENMSIKSTALAMAEMPWSREYFEKLRSEKQARIEQGGIVSGTVKADGKEYTLNMKGIRDHGWGKRNWSYINRYIWIIVSLNREIEIAGEKINYLVISPVDYGETFKRLASGWLGGKDTILPVDSTTDLALIGEDGVIPEKFNIQFEVPGSDVLTMSVVRKAPEMPWIVQNGAFEVNEAWCAVEINGVKGTGLAEFGYAAGRGYNRPFETE